MSASDTYRPLLRYETGPNDIFEALDSGPGLALARLPKKANTRRLIQRFGELVRSEDSHMLQSLKRLGSDVEIGDAFDHTDMPGQPETDTERLFVEDYDLVFDSLYHLVQSSVTPRAPKGVDTYVFSLLRAAEIIEAREPQVDTNYATIFMGAEDDGLKLHTPDGPLPVGLLPRSHVLIARQSGWRQPGIPYEIHWCPPANDVYRVSVTAFVGRPAPFNSTVLPPLRGGSDGEAV
jgi:hypothetical protein